MANSVYQIVTEKILEKLQQGTVPWRKPWRPGFSPVNWISQREYRGINTMLLDPGEYATLRQINERGGKVKKGQKANIVVFWKMQQLTENEEGEETKTKTKNIPLLRYYKVFEINTQCEGLNTRRKNVEDPYCHNPIEEAEKIVHGYPNAPEIRFAPGQAYYSPLLDYISIPALCEYKNPEEYYSTQFHELAHSTGHSDRLNRSGITQLTRFGSHTYSKEELVAEMAAAMLCGIAGIANKTLDNSAAYIKSWHRKLKEDPKLIIFAAAQGQKAADYILGRKPSYDDTEEVSGDDK